uniref:Uncharacterized protein n=1 Tax=Anguilla anguilla TaxID=7936 RepID=A0A0E9X0E6_ANGAN
MAGSFIAELQLSNSNCTHGTFLHSDHFDCCLSHRCAFQLLKRKIIFSQLFLG